MRGGWKMKALSNWTALNDALRGCTQSVAEALLKAELEGRKRKQFIMRIHSRINMVRADTERAALKARMAS